MISCVFQHFGLNIDIKNTVSAFVDKYEGNTLGSFSDLEFRTQSSILIQIRLFSICRKRVFKSIKSFVALGLETEFQKKSYVMKD